VEAGNGKASETGGIGVKLLKDRKTYVAKHLASISAKTKCH